LFAGIVKTAVGLYRELNRDCYNFHLSSCLFHHTYKPMRSNYFPYCNCSHVCHSAKCWRRRSSLYLRSHSPILPFICARGICWVRSCSNC